MFSKKNHALVGLAMGVADKVIKEADKKKDKHGTTSHGNQHPSIYSQGPQAYNMLKQHLPGSGHSQSQYQPSGAGNAQSAPVSGERIPFSAGDPFPLPSLAGGIPGYDTDGRSPLYFGSAILPNSVQPCKIAASHDTCYISQDGKEVAHQGRYDLLVFDYNAMELVKTSHGYIPSGRRPVEGGYGEDGGKLYHAVAVVQGARVPGKTGTHLYVLSCTLPNNELIVLDFRAGAIVPFGEIQHTIVENYEIL